VIERILPPQVAVAEAREDVLDEALFAAEEATVAAAVQKRQREFATGRACARRALADLGFPPQPIPTGPRGAPSWPAGAVGSITHCDRYRAAAVARGEVMAAIGIDAEPNAPLPEGVLGDIALPEERAWLTSMQAAEPTICWDRLLFCMKEAVYKAWFPLTGLWLDFEDAVVEVDGERRTFAASLSVPGPTVADRALDGFEGRWLMDDGVLLAAIALPVRGW
jgi:4'-phosphopantetheinyl transferase EntD